MEPVHHGRGWNAVRAPQRLGRHVWEVQDDPPCSAVRVVQHIEARVLVIEERPEDPGGEIHGYHLVG